MYGTAYRGIYDQSLVLTEDFKQMLDKTSQNTVMPPQQAVLNQNHTNKVGRVWNLSPLPACIIMLRQEPEI